MTIKHKNQVYIVEREMLTGNILIDRMMDNQKLDYTRIIMQDNNPVYCEEYDKNGMVYNYGDYVGKFYKSLIATYLLLTGC